MKATAYLLQATLVSLWWLGMMLYQDFTNAFQFPGISNLAFNAFMLPDLIVVACLSVVRAYYKYKRELGFIILGGFAFASLYCVNASLLTGGGFLSTTLMVLGGLLWQLVVRPIEEQNMKLRFGDQYDTYCKQVRCWIPWV